jgi:hypothetical protein
MRMLSEISLVGADVVQPAEIRPHSDSVRRIDPLEEANWDARLKTCPAATFFHGTAWARVLQSTYGYTPAYFTMSESGCLRSLLPIMEVTSWLTGRRGVSLPFTDDCEPLWSDAALFRDLFRMAVEYGVAHGWKYLECRGGKLLFAEAPVSTAFHGHRLTLVSNVDALFAGVESAVRRAIRKAERSGVSVEVSRDLDAVRVFYGLHCRTRRKHGQPPQPFRFFRSIHDHVLSQDQGFVVLARYRQVPVAAAVFFHLGKKAIYKYGASDETFQDVRANDLVMWEAIRWYAQNGYEQLHFGRTSLANEGLRRFKLGWGAEEHRIEYVRYDMRTDGFVTADDGASGWHTRVFQMLPSVCGRLAGAALYKHVA